LKRFDEFDNSNQFNSKEKEKERKKIETNNISVASTKVRDAWFKSILWCKKKKVKL